MQVIYILLLFAVLPYVFGFIPIFFLIIAIYVVQNKICEFPSAVSCQKKLM